MANDLINYAYGNSHHKYPKGLGLETFQVDEHMEVLGERRTQTQCGDSTPFPYTLPYTPPIRVFICILYYIIL